MLEKAILVALMGVVIMAIVGLVGDQLTGVFCNVMQGFEPGQACISVRP